MKDEDWGLRAHRPACGWCWFIVGPSCQLFLRIPSHRSLLLPGLTWWLTSLDSMCFAWVITPTSMAKIITMPYWSFSLDLPNCGCWLLPLGDPKAVTCRLWHWILAILSLFTQNVCFLSHQTLTDGLSFSHCSLLICKYHRVIAFLFTTPPYPSHSCSGLHTCHPSAQMYIERCHLFNKPF